LFIGFEQHNNALVYGTQPAKSQRFYILNGIYVAKVEPELGTQRCCLIAFEDF
jgi:hypothetical protein